MIVNINELLELKEKLNEINSIPLEEIEFYENGELVEIPEELLEQWDYIGLNNVDFITTGYYKENPNKGWLQKQADAARLTVESWPEGKQEAMKNAIRNKD